MSHVSRKGALAIAATCSLGLLAAGAPAAPE
jgi:hypothetical protein